MVRKPNAPVCPPEFSELPNPFGNLHPAEIPTATINDTETYYIRGGKGNRILATYTVSDDPNYTPEYNTWKYNTKCICCGEELIAITIDNKNKYCQRCGCYLPEIIYGKNFKKILDK